MPSAPHPGPAAASPEPLSPPRLPPPRLRGLKDAEPEGAGPQPEEPRGSGAGPAAGKGGASWEDLKAQGGPSGPFRSGWGAGEGAWSLCAALEAVSARSKRLKLMEMRFSSSPRLKGAEGPARACIHGRWGSGPVPSGRHCLWGDLPCLCPLWAHTAESSLVFGLNNYLAGCYI